MQPIYLSLIFLPIGSGIVLYLTRYRNSEALVFPVQAVMTLLAGSLLANYQTVSGVFVPVGGWSILSGIVLLVDNLSMAFIALTVFMWWMILLYSWQTGNRDHNYLFFLSILQGLFMGLLLVNDLFSFFLFFEIVTVTASVLVVFKRQGKALTSGLYYLLLGTTGMAFYLLGMMIVYMLTGTLNWSQSAQVLAELGAILPVQAAFIFMVASMTIKAAFFPTFDWLSRAHSNAPHAISALLSGLLVKGGVYGFIRIHQLFGGAVLGPFFFYVGFATALTGVVFAVSQKDIKMILAFHTISQVGIVLIGVSQVSGDAYYGGLLHLVNHAMFKSLLFLCAGVIATHYNTRKVVEIRGALRTMPVASVCMIVGALAITGTPFLNGYIGKAIIGGGLKYDPAFNFLFRLISLGTIVSFMKLSQIFFPGDVPCRAEIPEGTKAPSRRVHWNIALLVLAANCILLPQTYGRLGLLLGTTFPAVDLLDPAKITEWAVLVLIGLVIMRLYIFTDRSKAHLQRIREVPLPFQRSAYMFLLFVTIMFLQGIV